MPSRYLALPRYTPWYKRKGRKPYRRLASRGLVIPRRSGRVTSGMRFQGPVMVKRKFTFPYHENQISIDPGTGGAAHAYVFSCNGLYDPNITGTGHQPRGFDQLMTLYDHYVVIGAKVTVNFSTGTDDAMIVGVAIKDSSTAEIAPNNYMESRYNSYKRLDIGNVSGQGTSITVKVNPNKFLGRSKPLSDSTLKGTSSANPSEQCYFHCYAFPFANLDTAAVNLDVMITYTAVLIEPKLPAES